MRNAGGGCGSGRCIAARNGCHTVGISTALLGRKSAGEKICTLNFASGAEINGMNTTSLHWIMAIGQFSGFCFSQHETLFWQHSISHSLAGNKGTNVIASANKRRAYEILFMNIGLFYAITFKSSNYFCYAI